jgi:hypothetical protein
MFASPAISHERITALAVLCAIALVSTLSIAVADSLKPFKDELFAYPRIVSTEDGGAYTVVDYSEARDINERDQVPERRVRGEYVSTGVRRQQQDLVLQIGSRKIRHFAVGKTTGARFITIYLHGQGGSRKQGVDDFTFGGNFNRIKNLMAGNGGLYLSPDFPDFGEGGAGQVAALINHYAEQSPGARVFVACGSMGGGICWILANDPALVGKIGGLLLLGSHWDDGFLGSAAFKRKVPVFFGHGGNDTVFPITKQVAFFHSILAKSRGYPAKFVRFETGTHGTPIRMSDWRETLNWMLGAAR